MLFLKKGRNGEANKKLIATVAAISTTAAICAGLVTNALINNADTDSSSNDITEINRLQNIDDVDTENNNTDTSISVAKNYISLANMVSAYSARTTNEYTATSIINWVATNNLPDGSYYVTVSGINSNGITEKITYPIELVNYTSDMTYTTSDAVNGIVSLGDDSADYKMLVVKYHGDLTIQSGVTLTANTHTTAISGTNYELTYKKGMYIHVCGRLTNNGTISMTGRGTYNQAGENVYLWRNLNSTYEFVPKVGGAGAAAASAYGSIWNSSGWYYNMASGKKGSNGENRGLGGGGSGGVQVSNKYTITSGKGSTATSYSGGSGGGGAFSAKGDVTGYSATENGGAGGKAYTYENSGYSTAAGGGAGNPGGYSYTSSGSVNQTRTPTYDGETGTGGLMIIYANEYNNLNKVESNGKKGGQRGASGGGSGGGSVNIFYNKLVSTGTANATGGEKVRNNAYFDTLPTYSGPGGDGTVTYLKIPAPEIPKLKSISINGTNVAGFISNVNDYEVTLDKYIISAQIGGTILGEEDVDVTGFGYYQIDYKNSTTVTIKLVNQYGIENKYNVIIKCTQVEDEHSTKLANLVLKDYNESLEPIFSPDVTEYSVILPINELTLDLKAVAFDSHATVEVIGNKLMLSNSGTVIIRVTEPNIADSKEYKITYIKNTAQAEEYSAKEGYYTFTAPTTGKYKVELWGAQGGVGYISGRSQPTGGKGAYTSGILTLKKGQKLFVYVGGKGASSTGATSKPKGGYNGGGQGQASSDGDDSAGGGGGATDVRLVASDDPKEIVSLRSRIMVAAGGGGAHTAKENPNQYVEGMYGGTLAVTGQLKFWTSVWTPIVTQTQGGTFGFGLDGPSGTPFAGAGGGGGYYGGYSGKISGDSGRASGGSSYISGYLGAVAVTSASDTSPRKDSNGMVCEDGTEDIECSYHYSGLIFEDGVMLGGLEQMPSYSNANQQVVGNAGDGYARITPVNLDKNNYLRQLIVTNPKTGERYTLSPEFESTIEEYSLTLTENETEIEIEARPASDLSEIFGLGKYEVLPGNNTYEVKVVSESQDERIYKLNVERPASTVATPKNIIITGLVDSLCYDNENYCKLNNQFDENIHSYIMTIPSGIRDLEFTVEKNHPYQKVIGSGITRLKGGINIITIEVTSEAGVDEDGIGREIYTYEINRDMTGDNYIDTIEFLNPELENLDIGFHHLIQEYYFKVPNNVTKLDMNIILDDTKNASYEIIGNDDFEVGNNIVKIVVTAGNGDERTYILNVYRMKNSNALLDSLVVKRGNEEFSISPEFEDIKNYYTLTVPYEIDSVEILASAQESSTTTVSGAGTKNLKVGRNQFVIETVAQDNVTKEKYTVVITRLKNSNNYLKQLTVAEGDLDPVFELEHKEIDIYRITVNPYVKSLNITAKAEEEFLSKVTITGNSNFKIGENTVRIRVTAQDGSTRDYYIIVTKEGSDINTLLSLSITPGTLDFNENTNSYTVNVPYSVSKVVVSGTKKCSLSKVTGLGTYNLVSGANTINVKVVSETGLPNTYTITVNRAYNTDATLKTLTVSNGTLSPTFASGIKEYTVNVGNDVSKITIGGTPTISTTKVTGRGTYNLNVGQNEFVIDTLAEDGVSEEQYKITITRDESSNANLEYLNVREGKLTPVFSPMVIGYTVKVPNNVENVNIDYRVEDSLATATLTKPDTLVVGENTATVEVVAKDNTKKTYTITIIRQEVSLSNLNLKSLSVSNCSINFNKDTIYYECDVDYSVSQVIVSAEAEDSVNNTVSGTGNKNLVVGKNVINVTVSNDAGEEKTYQVVVTRRDRGISANLEYLNVREGKLTPVFNPNTTSYTVKVQNSVEDVTIDYRVEDSLATVSVNKTTPLVVGNNEVTVTVTAVYNSTKVYKINVIRQDVIVSNLNLKSLEITDCALDFNKDTTYYECEVSYNVSQVTVSAEAEDSINNTVSGTGTKNLVVGKNVINVTVSNEYGEEKTYQVVITRRESDDPRLNGINITGHKLDEITFVPDDEIYHVSTKLDKLDIIPVKKNSKQTVVISGNENFVLGENTVTLTVTSADGSKTKTYTLIVTKEKNDNNYLSSLEVAGYDVRPIFSKEKTDYYVTVENEIESIIVIANTEDENATINGGTSTLLASYFVSKGENAIELVVAAENGQEKTYTLHVTKLGSRNNLLDSLSVVGSTLVPDFDPLTNTYSIGNVPYETESIEVIAQAAEENATISGDGIRDLVVGNNQINVTVIPEYGQSRTYTINVIRNQPVTSKLKNIKVRNYDLDKVFESDDTDYTVIVDYEVDSIDLIITKLDPNSTYTISGNGGFELGKENIVTIHSVSSDTEETTDYTIKVIKQAYSNTYLDVLSVSPGELEPEFNKSTLTYNVTVPYEVSSITIYAYAEQENSTVTGVGVKTLNVGLNEYKIKVTSTGGVTRTYTVNVTRIGSDNANIISITSNLGTVEKIDDSNYMLKVQKDISMLTKENFTVKTSDPLAVVQKMDSLNLSESNKYEITVTSPDGNVVKGYTVNISYIMSNNTALSTLTVVNPENRTLSPAFSSNLRNYTLDVLDTQTQVEFNATVKDDSAHILNESLVFDLDEGYSTDIYIYVEAEDGVRGSYKITVNKSITTEKYPQNIEITGTTSDSIVPEFNEETDTYNITVPYEVSNIDFNVVKKHQNQIVKIYDSTGNEVSKYPLIVGNNTYTIKVQNNIGDETTYTYNIERLKSTNNWLESLKLTNPKYEFEDFDREIYDYYVVVPNDCVNVTVEAIPEDKVNTYISISGATYLAKGDNDITIDVYNAYNEARRYTIHVLRTPDKNNLLQTLTISSGDVYTLTPKFTPGITEYSLQVESVISQLKIDAIPYDDNATVKMTIKKRLNETQNTVIEAKQSMVNLKVGTNIINIDVTVGEGEEKATRTYTLNVTRKAGNNAYIENLIIRNGTLEGEFAKEKTNYTVNVENDITSLDMTVITEDPGAKYQIIGNSDFVYGENEVKIKVTSSEGSVSKTYTLTVNKAGDHNSKLDKLYINDELLNGFDPNVITYNIQVENNVESADIRVELASEVATVTGDDCYDLQVGLNTIVVTVTAQDGTSTTDYTLNITRKTNCYLSEIKLGGGHTLKETFDKTKLNYTVEVEDDKTIEIEGIAEDEINATVDGNRTYNLNIGDNTIKLKVTNGDFEKEYTVVVNRKGSTNTYLEYLTIENSLVTPTFVKTTREYTVEIPNTITSLTMEYAPEDKTSQVEVIGNANFNTNEPVVKIKVTPTSGEFEYYTLNVIREDPILFSNRLASLTVDKGTLTPRFDKDTKEYIVTVPYNTDDITIDATPETSAATITGIGTHTLEDGRNQFDIVVKSKAGVENTYTVIVYKLTTANIYNITYVLNDGVNNQDNPETYVHGIGTELKDATKEGYSFLGWYLNATFDENKKIENIDAVTFGDITVYAKFNVNTYNIEYILDGGDNSLDNPSTYTYGVGTKLKEATKTGYTFEGWYSTFTFDEGTKVDSITTTDKDDKVLYAKFVIDEYSITYYHNEEVLELTPSKYTYGTGVTLPNYDLEGYSFEGWYTTPTFDENSKITEISDTSIGNVIVYAKFSQDFGIINGRITTKNVDKHYYAKVTLYKHGDRTTHIEEVDTNEDGTYTVKILDVDENKNYLGTKFDMVISKPGYLNYTIENIQIGKGEEVNIGKYDLIPGDVVKDGIVELDDLVHINEYYGVEITEENKATMGKYDLNEDGIINKADRDLVIENLDAQEETVAWETIVNPVTFSLFNAFEDEEVEEDISNEDVNTNEENSAQETNEEENINDNLTELEEVNNVEKDIEIEQINVELDE